jgi:hypothetical protein
MKGQTRRTSLTWGIILIVFGVMSLVNTYAELTIWAWAGVLAVAGAVSFLVYLTGRHEIGPLLLTYILWAIALLLTFIELKVLQDEAIATYVLSVIALPFLVVYFRDRGQWWALIPAYVLLVVGLMVILLERVLTDLLVPAYVLFAVALPFFIVYFRDRANWWALIPGGIMAIVGFSFLISASAAEYILPIALILGGVWLLLRNFGRRPLDEVPAQASQQKTE